MKNINEEIQQVVLGVTRVISIQIREESEKVMGYSIKVWSSCDTIIVCRRTFEHTNYWVDYFLGDESQEGKAFFASRMEGAIRSSIGI